MRAPTLAAALSLVARCAAAPPCRAPYATPAAAAFETPCADALFSAGALEVRRYPAARARPAQLAHVNFTARGVSFAEALLNGAEFLFCYFEGACNAAHEDLYALRTVPLTLRRAGGAAPLWLTDMALAPSRLPGAAPRGENGIEVLPLGALVAARHCDARAQPQEADFDACWGELAAAASRGTLRAAGWALDEGGAWNGTRAFFTFQNQTEPPFDFEVWGSAVAV